MIKYTRGGKCERKGGDSEREKEKEAKRVEEGEVKKKRLTNSKAENDARKNFYEQKIMCDVLEKVFFFFWYLIMGNEKEIKNREEKKNSEIPGKTGQ